jgi:hypothetical protein
MIVHNIQLIAVLLCCCAVLLCCCADVLCCCAAVPCGEISETVLLCCVVKFSEIILGFHVKFSTVTKQNTIKHYYKRLLKHQDMESWVKLNL